MPETVIVKGEGLTVDLIVWRKYGVRGRRARLVEKTLKSNPGLAALGLILPLGASFDIPDLDPDQASDVVDVVSLFD